MILRGSHVYPDDPMNSMPVAERIITRYWGSSPYSSPVPFFMPQGEDPNTVIFARINDGRWIADCPWCPSAIVADPDDPRFFCVHCTTGAHWVRIIFPDELKEIEAILNARSHVKHRSWQPGESIHFLKAESDFLAGRSTREQYLVARYEISGTNISLGERKPS